VVETLIQQIMGVTEGAVHPYRRFVDTGGVVCSAGMAAGIDMSLHVVSRLLG